MVDLLSLLSPLSSSHAQRCCGRHSIATVLVWSAWHPTRRQGPVSRVSAAPPGDSGDGARPSGDGAHASARDAAALLPGLVGGPGAGGCPRARAAHGGPPPCGHAPPHCNLESPDLWAALTESLRSVAANRASASTRPAKQLSGSKSSANLQRARVRCFVFESLQHRTPIEWCKSLGAYAVPPHVKLSALIGTRPHDEVQLHSATTRLVMYVTSSSCNSLKCSIALLSRLVFVHLGWTMAPTQLHG